MKGVGIDMDVLKMLQDAGFKPEVVEDVSFEPLHGKYVCRIDDAGRNKGKSDRTGNEYDFRSMSMQVVETISGDKGENRFLKRNYNVDEEGMKKLLNDFHTAGIEVTAKNDEELDAFLMTLKDKTINASAWVTKEFVSKQTGKTIPGGKQAVRIVNKFKSKGDKSDNKASTKVPF